MEKHYDIMYDLYGYISKMCCNHCTYIVTRYEVKATRTGHRWPGMSHVMKRHLRDTHDINLYRRA